MNRPLALGVCIFVAGLISAGNSKISFLIILIVLLIFVKAFISFYKENRVLISSNDGIKTSTSLNENSTLISAKKGNKTFLNQVFVLFLCILMYCLGAFLSISLSKPSSIEYWISEVQSGKSTVSGTVSNVYNTSTGYKCIINVTSVSSGKSVLSIKKKEYISVYYEEFFEPESEVTIRGEIMAYTEPMNQGEFNLYNYNKARNIQGYIYADEINCISKDLSLNGRIGVTIYKLRVYLTNGINSIFDEDAAGILIAMITGDKSYLDSDLKDMYQQVGFAHILAISGVHISVIGMALFKMLSRKNKVSVMPALCTLAILCVYYKLTGGQVSCERAIFMLLFSLTAGCIGRRADYLTSLSFAAFIILLRTPYAIFDISFLMSFAAGLGIYLFQKYKEFNTKDKLSESKKILNEIKFKIYFTLCIQIAILPVQMMFFYTFCPYSIILNLILLPFVNIILGSGIIAGVLGGISIVLSSSLGLIGKVFYYLAFISSLPAKGLLAVYNYGCTYTLKLPYSLIATGHLSVGKFIYFSLMLVTWILLGAYYKEGPSDIPLKERLSNNSLKERLSNYSLKESFKIIPQIENFKNLPLLLIFLIVIPIHGNKMKISQLYIGQGDCCIITLKDKVIMVDGGSSDKSNIYKYIIKPYLNYSGYTDVDFVFISHSDADHISGISEMLEAGSDAKIILPKLSDYSSFEENGIYGDYKMTEGDEFKAGELKFICLYPDSENCMESDNDTSLVLYMKYRDFSMLFMGDLSETYEDKVTEYANSIGITSVDILKVGHHGSKTSSSEELLNYFSPETTVISCGIDNSYGHPTKEALERIQDLGADVYVTSEVGQITLEVSKSAKPALKTYVDD
jgi:competence protein ComEC